MMIKHKGISCVTVVCVILGIIIGIQAKTVNLQSSVYNINRVNELSSQLTSLQNENIKLREELLASQTKVREYELNIAKDSSSLKTIMNSLDELKLESGRIPVVGRGVTVTLNDSKKATSTGGVEQSAFLVHAEDILSIINELFSAGAEAISINDQRLIATSSVRCAGSIVNVNGNKIAAPFVITAIGDPDTLESALVFPGGVVDSLAPWGIELEIKKNTKVNVPQYNGVVNFKELKKQELE